MDVNEDSPLWVTICRIIATEFGLPVDFPVDFLSTAEERERAYCEA